MYACNQLYSSPMSRREDAAKRLIGGEDGKVDSILVISLLTKQYFISGNVLNPESVMFSKENLYFICLRYLIGSLPLTLTSLVYLSSFLNNVGSHVTRACDTH